MDRASELMQEKAYLARVQQLLYAAIGQSENHANFHDESIRMILADAWDELREKPTALSPQDLQQLSIEIDRYLARQSFSRDLMKRYERMLLNPFFARVDFREAGGDGAPERIVIGLYSLKGEKGQLMVHDWRAPISGLYYDASPGPVEYQSPSGPIRGEMTLKRQYAIEEGRLKYYVDTDVSIDDQMLLDLLSRATTRHMQQIVSTIQREQNAAIRHENTPVLSVIGCAGSGKTSVALHRAAYLMYHQRDQLDARRIAIVSPSDAFSEYISTVLPDLGEENTRSLTLAGVLSGLLNHKVEQPGDQAELLLKGKQLLRTQSVAFKAGQALVELLAGFAQRFAALGPQFEDLSLSGRLLASGKELTRLYREEFQALTPAQRLTRIQAVLASRLESWEHTLRDQYERQFLSSYRGKDLEFASRMATAQRLHPLKSQIRQLLSPSALSLYAQALADAPEALAQAARENAENGLIWWEDAPGVAYLAIKLGFRQPNASIRHLVIDEAQDYSEVALRALHLIYPNAHVTLLGDPNQRTCPGLPPCDAAAWGPAFDFPDAPLVELTRCYRSTLPITQLLNGLLSQAPGLPVGRSGQRPLVTEYDPERLRATLAAWREAGHKSIAVITRTIGESRQLNRVLTGVRLITGDDSDLLPEFGSVTLACYHLLKGLEFDAVAVVWPEAALTDGERRRLYTSCSRALHALALFVPQGFSQALGLTSEGS